MTVAAVILLAVCYGLALYLTWAQRTPIYLLALASGHLSAVASPLWQLLYDVRYDNALAEVRSLIGQPIPLPVLLAAGWFYPLPALLVFFLYRVRWWFPGTLTGLLTYLVFLLYHLLIEALGVRSGTWAYNGTALPFEMPPLLLSAIMAALISLGLLYVLISTWRYAGLSMLLAVLPATLLFSLLIHGLLGAPLWVALLLDAQPWATAVGLLSSLALLGWAIQIMTYGFSRLERN
jgi:hypothetical protein